jgi:hypothetical protein
VLNVVFGGSLYLCGLTELGQFAPSLAEYQPLRLDADDARAYYAWLRTLLVQKLDRHQALTKSAAEKESLKHERLEELENHPKFAGQFDWPALNRNLLRLSWFVWFDVVTAPVLSLFMLASGVGLIQLRRWARTMAIWVAALKVARLAVLAVLLFAVVFPSLSQVAKACEKTDVGRLTLRLYELYLEEKSPIGRELASEIHNNPDEARVQFEKALELIAGFFLFVGAVYPATTLWVLTRPATKLACDREEPTEE